MVISAGGAVSAKPSNNGCSPTTIISRRPCQINQPHPARLPSAQYRKIWPRCLLSRAERRRLARPCCLLQGPHGGASRHGWKLVYPSRPARHRICRLRRHIIHDNTQGTTRALAVSRGQGQRLKSAAPRQNRHVLHIRLSTRVQAQRISREDHNDGDAV